MPIVCIFVIIVLIVCWAIFVYEIMLELCVLAIGESNLTLFGLNFSCGLNMNRWS